MHIAVSVMLFLCYGSIEGRHERGFASGGRSERARPAETSNEYAAGIVQRKRWEESMQPLWHPALDRETPRPQTEHHFVGEKPKRHVYSRLKQINLTL